MIVGFKIIYDSAWCFGACMTSPDQPSHNLTFRPKPTQEVTAILTVTFPGEIHRYHEVTLFINSPQMLSS